MKFKLAAFSNNTNSFGLNNHVFVAPDGTAFTAAAYRGPGGKTPQVGDVITVPVTGDKIDFAQLTGYEIPHRLPDAPKTVVTELWPAA